MLPIHEKSILISTADYIYLVPPQSTNRPDSGPGPDFKSLCIDRNNGRISMESPPSKGSNTTNKKVIYGILGIMEVPNSKQILLVVVTRKVLVGNILNHSVWRVETVEIIEVKHCQNNNDEITNLFKNQFINVFSTPYFYFSLSFDLSRNQQSLAKVVGNDSPNANPFVVGDKRFLWNYNLVSKFLEAAKTENNLNICSFLLPLIHGAVFVNKCSINSKGFTWNIISRRSRHRVGARLFMRGCDEMGNAANFVETEQIVESEAGLVSSFVQTRGSIPLHWQQNPNLKYKPPPTMIDYLDSTQTFLAHIKEQISMYGKQVLVNLVDQKKAEGLMEQNYQKIVNEVEIRALNYIAYDFHKECKNMRYDRLSILINKLESYIQSFEYYFYSPHDSDVRKEQSGVIRTNCVDSLDRTNVVQSLLAAENLKIIFKRMGILRPLDDISSFKNFQSIFKNTWADHADMISVQYAGTGALKTDFTRTGKRTRYGLLQDGWNSINRYYLNNFMDGSRTDAQRLIVGEITAEEFLSLYHQHTSRLSTRGAISYLPHLFLLVLVILAFILCFSNKITIQFLIILAISIGSLVFLTKQLFANGTEFVNNPVTVKLMN